MAVGVRRVAFMFSLLVRPEDYPNLVAAFLDLKTTVL